MEQRLVEIFLASALTLVAGFFLIYLGFISPVFRRSSELLAPDPSVGKFRLVARLVGPLLCLLAGLRIVDDIRRETGPRVLQWREVDVPEGRFRVSSPADFSKDSKEIAYGDWRVAEHFCRAVLPRLGFLISYLDLPESLRNVEPAEILNGELERHLHSGGVQLISKDTTLVSGHPAVHFKLHDVPGGFYVEGILLLAGARRYQLAVQFTDDSSAANRKRFFDSFQLLDGG